MKKPDSFVVGAIFFNGGLDELSMVLAAAGLENDTGPYALKLRDFPASFEIAWVGNLSPDEPYQVDGDGYGMAVETVALWCRKLSLRLRENGIKHDFAHCHADHEEIDTYHF